MLSANASGDMVYMAGYIRLYHNWSPLSVQSQASLELLELPRLACVEFTQLCHRLSGQLFRHSGGSACLVRDPEQLIALSSVEFVEMWHHAS